MLWKILSRTVQSLIGIVGLVLEGFGIYFSILQIANEPKGPFGWSILVWGVILFTVVAISVIVQFWWRIHKIEDSYYYALSFDGPNILPNSLDGNLAVKLSNGIDKPIEYKIDMEKTYVNTDDKISFGKEYPSVGAILTKSKNSDFTLPFKIFPIMKAKNNIFHLEVLYGRPGKLSFRQIREMNLTIQSLGGDNVFLNWVITITRDEHIV
jgi:hypothetical protein